MLCINCFSSKPHLLVAYNPAAQMMGSKFACNKAFWFGDERVQKVEDTETVQRSASFQFLFFRRSVEI